MCGIAGLVNVDGAAVDPTVALRMIDMIRHRGPDDDGVYADQRAALAHARLSIIDVSGGHQPMTNEDRSLWIVFNGEIFNYLELRTFLLDRGHRFATRSDTEVILHLFEEEGEDCVRRLNGQWAFAIWDSRRHRLFLSRDRVGVRPLFYTFAGRTFAFGSEIKALLAHPGVRRELDVVGLDQVFTFWAPVAPRTVFKGISELPPAHSLMLEADGDVRLRRYWSLDYRPSNRLSDEQSAARLSELLLDATRIRLRSDVPVGAYLSGGLDSTVVTTLVRRCTDTPLRTFSITFDDPEFDESTYQQEVVRILETEHTAIRCSYEQIGRVFPDVIWHAERPILRTAPAPLFLLSRLVREHGYKVVVTGEGSDEVLGGYDLFKEAKIRRFWATQPESRLRPLLLRRLYPYLKSLQSQSQPYLKAFFRVTPSDCSNPFFSHLPRWELTARLKLFFSSEVKTQLADYDGYAELRSSLPAAYSAWDGLSQAQYLEATSLLPGYILSSQGDRVAMAHAVEGRFPFLDHRVVEFAAALPARLKMKVLDEKHLLKQSMRDVVPAVVRHRKKQPYRAPDAKSFFGSPAQPLRHDYVDDLLSQQQLRTHGIFNPGAVQKLVDKARSGTLIGVKDNMALTGILSTQLFAERFLRGAM
jgi:asparagine synthase (glutamine-hydrolysing)